MKEKHMVQEAAGYVREKCPDFYADLAIVKGSKIINYDVVSEIPYSEIPNFPASDGGNTGKLILAEIKGRKCYILNGCFHLYEGFTSIEVIRPIRIFKELGVKTVILTNYSGAVNPDYEPGDIMMITDHINFGGDNPLIGSDCVDFGPRFPRMDNAYSSRLQGVIRDAAITLDIPMNEGIYIKFFGPSFETPAEVKFAKTVGADAIGMGMIFECIAAVQCNMEVAGISLITNLALGAKNNDNREEILNTCRDRLSALIDEIILKI